MKWVFIVGGVLIAIIALAALVGSQLPRAHRVSSQRRFPVPPTTVWAAITDVQGYPFWRTDVKKVELLPERDGKPAWIEEGRNGRMTFAIERMEGPRLLVTRIADPGLPFGGTWTFEIEPAVGGSLVTITERGEVYNPLFRFMARFIFGYEGTIAAYMTSLGKLR